MTAVQQDVAQPALFSTDLHQPINIGSTQQLTLGP